MNHQKDNSRHHCNRARVYFVLINICFIKMRLTDFIFSLADYIQCSTVTMVISSRIIWASEFSVSCLFQTFHLLPSSCAKQKSLACTLVSAPVKKLVWVSRVMARGGTTILLFCCVMEHIYFCSSENTVMNKNVADKKHMSITMGWPEKS